MTRPIFGLATAALVLALGQAAWSYVPPRTPVAPPPPADSDFRTPDPENVLVIDTNQGRILVELYPQIAPQAVARVKLLARQKFYDGLTFFRVIDGFMDQTGDPTNTGTGGSRSLTCRRSSPSSAATTRRWWCCSRTRARKRASSAPCRW